MVGHGATRIQKVGRADVWFWIENTLQMLKPVLWLTFANYCTRFTATSQSKTPTTAFSGVRLSCESCSNLLVSQDVWLNLINALMDYNYLVLIATLSAASVPASTLMIFRSSDCLVIAPASPKLTFTIMHGARSKLTGRGFRKQPQQDATQTLCAEIGPTSPQRASKRDSCTELLHGAGAVVGGVQVREVTLEQEKNSHAYRLRLREGLARFQDYVQKRSITCQWWLDVILVNQLLVDCINEMHENKIALCHARHLILAIQTTHRN